MIRDAENHQRWRDNLVIPYDPCVPWFRSKTDWIVEGLLPRDSLVVLAGDAKLGKTDFAAALSISVALGRPFMDLPTTESGVIWVAAEESQLERYRSLREHRIGPGDRIVMPTPYTFEPSLAAIPLYHCFGGLSFDNDSNITDLIAIAHQKNCRLIVVDPLYGVTNRDMSRPLNARRLLGQLKKYSYQCGITFLVLHQLSASSRGLRPADSIQLSATAGQIWTIQPKIYPDHREITLRATGRGDFANRHWSLISPGIGKYHLANPEVPYTTDQPRSLPGRITALLNEYALTSGQIASLFPNDKRSHVRVAIHRLVKEGKLIATGHSPRSRKYQLAQSVRDEPKRNDHHSRVR